MIKQISVFLENKMGSLSDVTTCLYEHGVDILALSLADTTDFGILRLIVAEPERASDALRDSGNAVKLTDVVAIRVSHKPGALCEILKLLHDHLIGVEYLYAFVGHEPGTANVIIKPSNIPAAAALLEGSAHCTLLSADDIK